MKSLPHFAITAISLAMMIAALQGRLRYFAIRLVRTLAKDENEDAPSKVHVAPNPNPLVIQMPDVKTETPTN